MSSSTRLSMGSGKQSDESDRSSHLVSLVRRVADEDRAAFAELHGRLAARLTEHLRSAALTPRFAKAIVAATFVEVWWLARYHTDPQTDVFAWLTAIAQRRTEEWKRHREPTRSAQHAWIAAGAESYYRRAGLALAELLDPTDRSRPEESSCA